MKNALFPLLFLLLWLLAGCSSKSTFTTTDQGIGEITISDSTEDGAVVERNILRYGYCLYTVNDKKEKEIAQIILRSKKWICEGDEYSVVIDYKGDEKGIRSGLFGMEPDEIQKERPVIGKILFWGRELGGTATGMPKVHIRVCDTLYAIDFQVRDEYGTNCEGYYAGNIKYIDITGCRDWDSYVAKQKRNLKKRYAAFNRPLREFYSKYLSAEERKANIKEQKGNADTMNILMPLLDRCMDDYYDWKFCWDDVLDGLITQDLCEDNNTSASMPNPAIMALLFYNGEKSVEKPVLPVKRSILQYGNKIDRDYTATNFCFNDCTLAVQIPVMGGTNKDTMFIIALDYKNKTTPPIGVFTQNSQETPEIYRFYHRWNNLYVKQSCAGIQIAIDSVNNGLYSIRVDATLDDGVLHYYYQGDIPNDRPEVCGIAMHMMTDFSEKCTGSFAKQSKEYTINNAFADTDDNLVLYLTDKPVLQEKITHGVRFDFHDKYYLATGNFAIDSLLSVYVFVDGKEKQIEEGTVSIGYSLQKDRSCLINYEFPRDGIVGKTHVYFHK